MEGWVKLYRSVLESRYFQDDTHLKVWVWLLCKASTKKRFERMKTGKGFVTVELQKGELIFGRLSAAKSLKVDDNYIYRLIHKMEEWGDITIKVNSQFTIITVLEVKNEQDVIINEEYEYEEIWATNEQPMNNQRTGKEQAMNNQWATNEQPMNTIKKVIEREESKEGEKGNKVEEGLGASANPVPLVPIPDPEIKNSSGKAPTLSRAKKPKANLHLFQDSPIFDKTALKVSLFGTQYQDANLDYYLETIKNWADSKGERKVDWLAAVKGWMGRDIKDGKFVDQLFKPKNSNGNQSNGRQPISPSQQAQNAFDIIDQRNQRRSGENTSGSGNGI